LKKIFLLAVFLFVLIPSVNSAIDYYDMRNWEYEVDPLNRYSYTEDYFYIDDIRKDSNNIENNNTGVLTSFDYYFTFRCEEMQAGSTTNMQVIFAQSEINNTWVNVRGQDALSIQVRSRSNANLFSVRVNKRDEGVNTNGNEVVLNVNQTYWGRFYWLGNGNLLNFTIWNDAYNGTIQAVSSIANSGTMNNLQYLAISLGQGSAVNPVDSDLDIWNFVKYWNVTPPSPPPTPPVCNEEIVRPDLMFMSKGVQDNGSLSSAWYSNDGDILSISEVVGADSFIVNFDFHNLDDSYDLENLTIREFYDGNVGHNVTIEIYNFTSMFWRVIGSIVDGTDYTLQNVSLTGWNQSNLIQDGHLRVRIRHVSAGNINHDLYIDYLVLYTCRIGALLEFGDINWLLAVLYICISALGYITKQKLFKMFGSVIGLAFGIVVITESEVLGIIIVLASLYQFIDGLISD
jgi:hypothetical protein